MTKDLQILRALANEYARYANDDKNKSIPDYYRRLNAKNLVRPPVLVFEIPWGEFSGCEELALVCENPLYRKIETNLRRNIYQFKNFRGEYGVPLEYRVHVALESTPTGLEVKEKLIPHSTGTYAVSHEYEDILCDEEALQKIKTPQITVNTERYEADLQAASEAFCGIMDIGREGVGLYFNMWDEIPRFHGVDGSLSDLYERPEFIHKMVDIFTRIQEAKLDCFEKLNLLETDMYYLHCTPALTYDLPKKDYKTQKITAADVWGRGMAQLFAVVSPQMHNEFDLDYMERLFSRCGLTYYGCCEPLDNKIDILRRFKNLRRISVTPWANPDICAEQMQGDYILSAKSNPSYVASAVFDPRPVHEETKRILLAAKRNGTPCEFILKDVSTVSENPKNLSDWIETVNETIERYW